MAYERNELQLTQDLDGLVQLRVAQLNKTKSQLRVKEEMKFQTQVLEQGLSSKDQKAFYDGLVEKEGKRNIPDQDYIAQLKAESASLDKRIRVEDLNDAMTSFATEYKAARMGADDYLAKLKDRMATTIDYDLKMSLRKEMLGVEGDIVQNYRDFIVAKVGYAQTEQTDAAYDEALKLVGEARENAIKIQDSASIALYDTKITVLGREKKTLNVANEEMDVDAQVLGGQGVDAKLSWLKNKKGGSYDATPFFYGGVRYDNEGDFWNKKFTGYVSGEYFTGKQTELKNKATAIFNTKGDLSTDDIQSIRTATDNVFNDPDLAPWKDTLGKTFQQSVLMGALDYKMTTIGEKLALNDDPKSLIDINSQITALQGLVPEISQHSSFNNLSVQYATKIRNMLQTRLQTFVDTKGSELGLLVDSLNTRTDISEEDRSKALNTIAGMQSQLGVMGTNLNFTDIPLSQFNFGTDPNAIFNQTIAPYSGLMGATQIEGMQFDPWVNTAIQGYAQQRGVDIPTGQTQPPATTAPKTTAPSAPNAPGSADYEKKLNIMGDTSKQSTMAGWGWQWQWSDKANQIGGYVPTNTVTKQKFKSTYGQDFSGTKATLGMGDKKVITWGYSPYSDDLFKQGYKLI
jgi:hypothetical protein